MILKIISNLFSLSLLLSLNTDFKKFLTKNFFIPFQIIILLVLHELLAIVKIYRF